jgi:hypothetical protein
MGAVSKTVGYPGDADWGSAALRKVGGNGGRDEAVPMDTSIAGNFRQVNWRFQSWVRELEQNEAREECVPEVTPELGECIGDEDGLLLPIQIATLAWRPG